jgi:hypothetical protein
MKKIAEIEALIYRYESVSKESSEYYFQYLRRNFFIICIFFVFVSAIIEAYIMPSRSTISPMIIVAVVCLLFALYSQTWHANMKGLFFLSLFSLKNPQDVKSSTRLDIARRLHALGAHRLTGGPEEAVLAGKVIDIIAENIEYDITLAI